MNIDRLAYISKLKNKDPMQKIIFTLLTLCVCLWSNSILISILVILTMGFITVVIGKIYLKMFLRLMLLPLSFLVIGVVTIALSASTKSDNFLWYFHLKDSFVGVSIIGMEMALLLFFKALGAVSCLYFLSLSTPMVSLMSALRRLKVPKLMLEIMSLVYRFIFVLMETADTIFTAQNARLGYSRISTGYSSLGVLVASVFIRAYKRSDDLYISLESRGYDGEFNILEEPFEKDRLIFIFALLINVVFITTSLFLKKYTAGGIM